MIRNYQYYKDVFKGQSMPFAFVDLDLFYENIKHIVLRANKKKVRIASKSVRSLAMLKKIFAKDPIFQGIMCFTVPEAIYLSQQGFDDLLVAYPCMQEKYIADVCSEIKKGKTIVLMVDSSEHVIRTNEIAGKHGIILPL